MPCGAVLLLVVEWHCNHFAGSHPYLALVSFGLIVVFAFGVPVVFGAILLWVSLNAVDITDDQKVWVAKELKTTQSEVKTFVRDVRAGLTYGFLVDAYRSKYQWWESIDLLRKLSIISSSGG